MKDIIKLILELADANIRIYLEDGKLKVDAPENAMADLLIPRIKLHKAALIGYLSDHKNGGMGEIPRAFVQSSYPLSSAQRRLWILSQFEESNIAYNINKVYVFEGELNLQALTYAFDILIARHEILRTVFREDEQGAVRQYIIPPQQTGFAIVYHDLSNEPQQESRLQTMLLHDQQGVFDLSRGPLLRAALYTVAANKWVFSYTMHHIISDGWSMGVLMNELLIGYNGYGQGESNALPPLAIQYKDYAVWQQEQLNTGVLQQHKAYWLQQFEGELPVLELTGDRVRPAIKTYNGDVVHTTINTSLSQGLKTLSLEQGGTLFMGLLAVVNTLLYRYTGQEDIVIGSTIAGREHIDLEDQIGFYVNILSLRARFNGADNYTTLFQHVRQLTLQAYEHQSYPFDELVEALNIQRDISRSALFDVFIDLQDAGSGSNASHQNEEKLVVHAYEKDDHRVSKFDLTFMFAESGKGLLLTIEYNSDLYNKETVTRMATHFEGLLVAILENPATPIKSLPFINEEERHLLLNVWNDTSEEDYQYRSLIALFEEQVQQNPEKVAVQYRDVTLTYSELNKLANKLTGYLIENYALKPGDLTGIMLDRSEKTIIAILGILKTGGAYVPIDPDYPDARKEYILKDTGLKVLLTQTDYIFDLPYYEGNVFAMDVQLDDIAAVNFSSNASIDSLDLAYVIYTSGSTGNPKGCLISHGNLSNYIQWANACYFRETGTASFGLFTSLSFDLTVTSIFCSLTTGGKLLVYGQHQEIADILSHYFDAASGLNSIKLTPSHISILEHLNIQSSGIRQAIVGGEEVMPRHVHILKNIAPSIKVYNEYGPTETTVGCVVKELEENTQVLIGKPIRNTTIYILDDESGLCATGVPGEICIGGYGVGAGYLNQAALTEKKFIPDPFVPGERIYRSGDKGKWLLNGELAFMGRKDDQVKIRGHRIEPGEITNTLLRHPAVKDAVVMVREDSGGNKNLVAYYVPHGAPDFTTQKIAALNNASLPEGAKLLNLPNDLKVFAYNKTELEFVYKEIYTEQCYLKNGIVIPDNGCIIDIGANMGMFAIFAGLYARNTTIYSFEPLPPTFELLKLNTAIYPGNYKVFNEGISDKEETAVFSYFPNATVLSSRYSEGDDITNTVKHTIINQEREQDEYLSEDEMTELLQERLVTKLFECKLKTLSQVIADNQIEQIDYLKIDVEKSELDVLNGIEDQDWSKIKQIAIEVHDVDGRLELITNILKARGFSVHIDQGAYLENTGLYDLFAISQEVLANPYNKPEPVITSEKHPTNSNNIENEIRTWLADQLPAYMVPAHFLKIPELPLTVNGKLDKKALPDTEENAKQAVNYVAPRNEKEEQLVAVFKEVLKKEQIGVRDDFFILGGDSIKSIQIISRLKQRGYTVAIQDVMLYPVIEVLASRLKTTDRIIEQSAVEGLVPVSPAQHWFFNNSSIERHHFNQSVLLNCKEELSEEGIRAVLENIVQHHDALRTVFYETDQGWVQEVKRSHPGLSFEVIDIADEAAFNEHCDRIQAGMVLQQGPLFKAALFRKGNSSSLLLVAHHLVIDGVSWRILFEDLSTLYQQYLSGETLSLPLKTDSFQYWQQKQIEYAQSPAIQKEAAYWSAVEAMANSHFPLNYPQGRNLMKDQATCFVALDKNSTNKLLTQCYKAFRTEINDILLTAFCLSVKQTFDLHKLLINLEGHGREYIGAEIDVSRTVGWFTTMYPVAFDLDLSNDIFRQLIEVKEKSHRIPNKGIGYGILRYLDNKDFKLQPSVSFNYLGDFGSGIDQGTDKQLFEYSGAYRGRNISANRPRTFLLDITGMVVAGRLHLSIEYSDKQYASATIENLLNNFRQQLETLISLVSESKNEVLSPVDLTFNDLPVDQLLQLNQAYDIEDIYPLSPLQEGLYYHWLSDPGSPAYFEQMCYRVKGKLNIDAASKSYSQLIARHAVLRTFFTQDLNECLLQVVKKDLAPAFTWLNVSENAEQLVEEYKISDRKRGFDLHTGSQMRLAILYLGEDTYEFIWSHHHILMDGWCVSILIKEFFQLYDALLTGKEPELSPVHAYANYITWLNKINRSIPLTYWQNHLQDYNEVSGIPKRPVRLGHTGQLKKSTTYLDAQTRESITTLCRELGVTENIFIQTVWGILLGKYNNTNDVVYGSVVSGRPPEVEGIETMIGLFVNTIPVRVRSNAGTTIRELLKQVQHDYITGEQHHYAPLVEIQSASNPGGILFDHILVFENYPVQEMVEKGMANNSKAAELSLLSSGIVGQTSYDLSVMVIPRETFAIQFIYNESVYEQTQIDRLQQHLLQMIGQVAKYPDKEIQVIDYLADSEKQQLLFEFNNTAETYLHDKTIVELFEEQVYNTPDAIALIVEDQQFTYQELNETGNRLGDFLRKEYNIKKEDAIGIKIPRNEWLVLSILGVLKASACCVVLDSDYPATRIDYIVEDSNCKLVIDNAVLSDFKAGLTRFTNQNLDHLNSSTDLAYVIYTSGSTGNPKGCMLENRGMINHLYSKIRTLALKQGEALCHCSELHFVGGIWQLWAPLVTGGKVVLCSRDELRDIRRLLHKVNLFETRVLELIPSQLNAYLSDEKEIRLGPVKTLILTGEKLTPYFVNKCYQGNKDIEIINTYGQTESSDVTTSYRIPKDFKDRGILIGRPIQNMQHYILTAEGYLCPPGVTGEICTSGDGTCRGYINSEELTSKKFIPHPFKAGKRLYRTGDLGKWTFDGMIEITGRKDEQVKIRGHRIELKEIENALLGYGEIEEVVLNAVPKNEEQELIAFLICKKTIDVAGIRAHLLGLLPDYMLPSEYIQLATLPVLPNGKVDKKALLTYKGSNLARGIDYIAPRTRTEKKLAQLWEKILHREKIGLKDNFFALGGHSLKATRLVSQMYKELDVKISIRDVFNNPELEQQVQLVLASNKSLYSHIEQAPMQESYPLSSAQRLFWISCQFEDANIAYNIPRVYVFEGNLNIQALAASFHQLIDRHEILRTVFRENAQGEVRQYIHSSDQINFNLDYRDLRTNERQEANVRSLVQAYLDRPFDLANGPLLRCGLFQLNNNSWVFAYVMHHIISDGWSMGILLKELLILYHTALDNKENPLPPLRIQYKDYAVWQQEQLQEGMLSAQKEYWLKRFEGSLPVLDLAADKPRPIIKTYNGSVVSAAIPAETTSHFKKLLEEQDCTLFMGLLAIVNTLLYRYTAQEDIIIGTSIAGREHPDLEDQIGYYLNTLALRTQFKSTYGYTQLLQQVKQVTLEAYEHQAYPFDELIEALQIQRDISRNNLFDAFVLLQDVDTGNKEEASDHHADMEVKEYIGAEHRVSKFDITFTFTDMNGVIQTDIEYNTDLFERAFVAKIAAHVPLLINAVINAPAQPVIDLEFINTTEKSDTTGIASVFNASVSNDF